MLSTRLWIILLAFISLVSGIALVSVLRDYGASLYPDSFSYLLAGENFIAGRGMFIDARHPLLSWPPLYSFLLGVGSLVFGTAFDAATWVNAAAYAGTVLVSGWLFAHYLRSRVLGLVGAIVIACSLPVIERAESALSEAVFNFLVVLALAALTRYRTSPNLRWLILAGLSLALTALTRYIGVVLIGWGALVIWGVNRHALKHALSSTVGFVLGAALPIAAWMLRNYGMSGTLTGARFTAGPTAQEAFLQTVTGLAHFYFPRPVPNPDLLWMLVLSLSISIVFVALRTNNLKREIKEALPVAALVLIYLGGLDLAARTTLTSPINARFLSPVFVPLTLLFAILARLLWLELMLLPRMRFVRWALVPLFTAWLLLSASAALASAQSYIATGGTGYNNKQWRASPTVAFVRDHLRNQSLPVYSNNAWALIFLTGIGARTMPVRFQFPDLSPESLARELPKAFPAGGKGYLVFFKQGAAYMFTPLELDQYYEMSLVAELQDGSVYMVSAAQSVGGD